MATGKTHQNTGFQAPSPHVSAIGGEQLLVVQSNRTRAVFSIYSSVTAVPGEKLLYFGIAANGVGRDDK